MSEYRVRLANTSNEAEVVLFEATPELVETRNVNYKTVDPIHAPGQIFAYVNTSARTFNISAVKLISRTTEEAEKNLLYLWRLRGWTMPEFGRGGLSNPQREARQHQATRLRNNPMSEQQRRQLISEVKNNTAKYGSNIRGTPPAVLYLSAYSPENVDRAKTRTNIHRVPVVIQNLSIPYPADTDYIPAGSSQVPMPTIMTLDMTLAETHSPAEYSNFSLAEFKSGTLRNF